MRRAKWHGEVQQVLRAAEAAPLDVHLRNFPARTGSKINIQSALKIVQPGFIEGEEGAKSAGVGPGRGANKNCCVRQTAFHPGG